MAKLPAWQVAHERAVAGVLTLRALRVGLSEVPDATVREIARAILKKNNGYPAISARLLSEGSPAADPDAFQRAVVALATEAIRLSNRRGIGMGCALRMVAARRLPRLSTYRTKRWGSNGRCRVGRAVFVPLKAWTQNASPDFDNDNATARRMLVEAYSAPIQRVPAEALRPAAWCPEPELKKAQRAALEADIALHGQRDPIIITAAGEILDGQAQHGELLALYGPSHPVAVRVVQGSRHELTALAWVQRLTRGGFHPPSAKAGDLKEEHHTSTDEKQQRRTRR